MNSNTAVLSFEITSNDQFITPIKVQERFFNDQLFHKEDQANVRSISCMTVKAEPLPNSQSIETIDVIMGLAGNIATSYLYDVIKDYIKGSKEIREERNRIIIDTAAFHVEVYGDNLSIDDVKSLIKAIK